MVQRYFRGWRQLSRSDRVEVADSPDRMSELFLCLQRPHNLAQERGEGIACLDADFLWSIPAAHVGKLRGGLQLAGKTDFAPSEQFAMRVVRRGVAWTRGDDPAQELGKLLAAQGGTLISKASCAN
jgi:hypothetical protein